jgi:hypothetical protein
MNGLRKTDLPRKVRLFLEVGLFLLIIKGTLREEAAETDEVALTEESEKDRERVPTKEVGETEENINGESFI